MSAPSRPPPTPAPPLRGASASWLASTSSRGRPTTSRRSSRSPSTDLPAELLQQRIVPPVLYGEQRLAGGLEQVVELALGRPRVDLAPIRQQLHHPASAGRLEQACRELRFQGIQHQVQL